MQGIRRTWLPLAAAALAVLVALPSFSGTTDAATAQWTSKCSVNLRLAPKVTSKVRWIIATSAVVTINGIVAGSSWSADCGGSFVKGSKWLRIVAVNGVSTQKKFGLAVVYAAQGLFKAGPYPTPTPKATTAPTAAPTLTPVASTNNISNCEVRLRTGASTDAGTAAIIATNTAVTASGTVQGGAWEADCAGSVSGSSWLKITAVGGSSVSSLYGVSAVYAASGLFRTSSSSSYPEGIDVSNWQGSIDWARVRGAGKTFVIAKATEGIGFKDDSYDRNKAGALGQGLKFGAYHFARPGSNDPVVEADWFVDTMKLQRGMIVPTLDLERTGGLGPTALTSWVKAWLQRVDERLGVKAMIYVSPSFWRENMNDSRWFADNGYAVLWVAHWSTSNPSVPAANWGGRSWTFWQYTSDGVVPGISGRVDLNRYRFQSFAAVTY